MQTIEENQWFDRQRCHEKELNFEVLEKHSERWIKLMVCSELKPSTLT